MSRPLEEVTTIDDAYTTLVPSVVRRKADVEPGDRIRWLVDEDGSLTIEVLEQRHGAFSELEPVDIGETTNAAADHDLD